MYVSFTSTCILYIYMNLYTFWNMLYIIAIVSWQLLLTHVICYLLMPIGYECLELYRIVSQKFHCLNQSFVLYVCMCWILPDCSVTALITQNSIVLHVCTHAYKSMWIAFCYSDQWLHVSHTRQNALGYLPYHHHQL